MAGHRPWSEIQHKASSEQRAESRRWAAEEAERLAVQRRIEASEQAVRRVLAEAHRDGQSIPETLEDLPLGSLIRRVAESGGRLSVQRDPTIEPAAATT